MDLSLLSEPQREIAQQIIEQCAMSRVWFITQVLKVEKLEDWQREELEALDNGETKLSIRSGHGVGKTAFCSWCALHFLLFRDDVKVIVTSPSLKQLTDGLIPEIQKWVNRLPKWMSMQLEITSERLTRKPNNKNNFVSFRTARKENPEALAGVHAQSVLIIVDEASGVDEVVYETGQGALSTVGSIAILIGNPTKPSGFFYKTHNELSDLWRTRKVTCMQSSRVSEDYIKSQERTYGRDSREFKVRVLGDFPDSGANAVIPRSYVESAQGRDIEPSRDGRVWGIDPGRGGDPSGFIDRTDNAILDIAEVRVDDVMRLTGWVVGRWNTTPQSKRPLSIFVDAIGLGAGIADRLSELGLPVVAVNVAEVASMSDRYVRLRDELWFETRHWFEPMTVVVPTKEENPLIEKLTHELSSVESEYMSNGKLQVESKEKMKRRGVKSPNLADALCLTFAGGGAVGVGLGAAEWTKVDVSGYRAPNVF
jgi:phage terminase large subunit